MAQQKFNNTIIINPITYNEFKYVCFLSITSIVTKENYRELIPLPTVENLTNNNKLIPLNYIGGPDVGSKMEGEVELKYGVKYEIDESGLMLKDEYGAPVIDEDNGVLFGLFIPNNIKHKDFNTIVVYSIQPDIETGYYSVAFVTQLNSFISFKKIINFYVRYIISINLEIVNLEVNYWDDYGDHNDSYDSSDSLLSNGHGNLFDKVTINSNNQNTDDLNKLWKKYFDFIKNESVYFQVKDDVFDVEVPSNQIQILKSVKVNKIKESIRSPYTFFYYNLYVIKHILLNGIKEKSLNTEEISVIRDLDLNLLKNHLKLGYCEGYVYFLYTWFSTEKYIYVIVMGSNSYNNIDIYRVNNKYNDDINSEEFNLVVGKYLDRVYFTINNNLHVCIPRTKEKLLESININDIDRFKKSLIPLSIYNELDGILENMSEEKIHEEYKALLSVLDGSNNYYYITKEQLYVSILSHNNNYSKYIKNGAFIWENTEGIDETFTSAEQFVESPYCNLSVHDLKNAIKYIKIPTDKINDFTLYLEKLIYECVYYEEDNMLPSPKVTYVISHLDFIKDAIDSSFSSNDNVLNYWQGVNGTTGVKNLLIINYLTTGIYNESSLVYFDYAYSLIELLDKVLLNWNTRELFTKNVYSIDKDTLHLFLDGFVEKALLMYPTLDVNIPLNTIKNFYEVNIYSDNNCIETEHQFVQFLDYCKYKAAYNFSKEATISYPQYIIKRFLLSKEKEGTESYSIISNFTIEECNELFYSNYLEFLNDINNAEWWNLEILNKLKDLYKEVSLTECFEEIPYCETDTFYYNGEKIANVPINEIIDDIPFRNSFPYPNYIYNSADYKGFIEPEHPKEHITGSYKSFMSLEENLKIPQNDGIVNSFNDLNELLKIKKDFTFKTVQEMENSDIIVKSYDSLEEMKYDIKIELAVDRLNDLPLVGVDEGIYYIKSNNSFVKYSTFNDSYDAYNDFVPNGSIVEVIGEDEKYYLIQFDAITNKFVYEECKVPSDGNIAYIIDINEYYRYSPFNDDFEGGESGYPDEYFGNESEEGDEDIQLSVEENEEGEGNDDKAVSKWVKITEEEWIEEITGKVYFCTAENKNYVYNGKNWVEAAIKYDILLYTFYEVTNEDEEFTTDIKDFSIKLKSLEKECELEAIENNEEEFKYNFTPNENSNIYKFAISNIKFKEGVALDTNVSISIYDSIDGTRLYTSTEEIIDDVINFSVNIFSKNPCYITTAILAKFNCSIMYLDEEFSSEVSLGIPSRNKVYTFKVDSFKKQNVYPAKTIKLPFTNLTDGDKYKIEVEVPKTDKVYDFVLSDISLKKDGDEVEVAVYFNNKLLSTEVLIVEDGKLKLDVDLQNNNNTNDEEDIVENPEIEEEGYEDEEGTSSKEEINIISIEINGIEIADTSITYMDYSYFVKVYDPLENIVFLEDEILEDKEGGITIKCNITSLNTCIIQIEGIHINEEGISGSYVWVRKPQGVGKEYYIWNGLIFEPYDMKIIPEANACSFEYDLSACINLFIEGDKLEVVRDLFRNLRGEVCKVVQFEFSNIGDVVLVLSYSYQGQDYWGGIFSRNRELDVYNNPNAFGIGIVVSKKFKDCINWESYSDIVWDDANMEISDARLEALESMYEISRSHYTNLSPYYDMNQAMFSNALTMVRSKDQNGSKRIRFFPKNLRMVINAFNIINRGTKVDINNYFVILYNKWIDLLYNRIYNMSDKFVDYNKRFLTANLGMCVLNFGAPNDINESMDSQGLKDGAYNSFDINTWYQTDSIQDWYESNDIPTKTDS